MQALVLDIKSHVHSDTFPGTNDKEIAWAQCNVLKGRITFYYMYVYSL